MNITLNDKGLYVVPCPKCGKKRTYTRKDSAIFAIKKNNNCHKCNAGKYWCGKSFSNEHKSKLKVPRGDISDEHRNNLSNAKKEYYTDEKARMVTSQSVKEVMHRPDIRKKHLDALHQSKWIKVKTDKGQLELIEKWNKLGFKFEPNYQIKTDTDLFYIDGYDKEKRVVLEYDSKYHNRPSQIQKDNIRQQKIIDILKPKKFWRYNSENKVIENVIKQ